MHFEGFFHIVVVRNSQGIYSDDAKNGGDRDPRYRLWNVFDVSSEGSVPWISLYCGSVRRRVFLRLRVRVFHVKRVGEFRPFSFDRMVAKSF